MIRIHHKAFKELDNECSSAVENSSGDKCEEEFGEYNQRSETMSQKWVDKY